MRERRTGRSGNAAASSALEQLAAIRQGKGKRSSAYEVDHGADIIAEVDEREYASIVEKRRHEDFIVDDDGLGYTDYGGDIFDESEGQGASGDGKADGARRAARRKPMAKPRPAPKRINAMLVGMQHHVGLSKDEVAPGDEASAEKTESGDLQGILDTLLSSARKRKELSARRGIREKRMRQEEALFGTPKGSLAPAAPVERRVDDSDPVRRGIDFSRAAEDAGTPSRADRAAVAPVKAEPASTGAVLSALDATPAMEVDEITPQSDMGDEREPDRKGAAPVTKMRTSNAEGIPEMIASEEAVPKPNFKVEESAEGDDADADAAWRAIREGKGSADSDGVGAAAGSDVAPAVDPALREGEDFLFYYLDAYEDERTQPGKVFLFGKTFVSDANAFQSACVVVENIERNLYVLPRATRAVDGRATEEPVSARDVCVELARVLREKYGVSRLKCKPVRRRYAFEAPGVPHDETEWIKVLYPANAEVPPSSLSGETFSHVFGASVSPLELLLRKRRIQGPCWLRLRGATSHAPVSWCKVERLVSSHKDVEVMQKQPAAPTLRVLSLTLRTQANAKTHAHEILAASGVLVSDVSVDGPTVDPDKKLDVFSAVRRPDSAQLPVDLSMQVRRQALKVEVCPNERALVTYLAAKVHSLDPDVLVGHNLVGYTLDVLLHRLIHHKCGTWAKIGRLRRSVPPKLSGVGSGHGSSTWAQRAAAAGRLLCDTYLAARELLLKEKNYSLSELVRTQLGSNRREVDDGKLAAFFSHSTELLHLLSLGERDAHFALQLMFKLEVLPLTKQLTCLGGNLWSRSLAGARAERIEYLLLHEFHRLKYVCPDRVGGARRLTAGSEAAGRPAGKSHGERDGGRIAAGGGGGAGEHASEDAGDGRRGAFQSGRRRPAYTGGLVLEPKRGLYDHFVLLLDFNSLYPSIIQEYNICFTTVVRADADVVSQGDAPPAEIPSPDCAPGVLPRLIKTLVERRRDVKKMLKTERDEQMRSQLDVRQKALKIMANSMYGCLGFSNSRFYAMPIAELITQKGRDALQMSVTVAQAMGLEVIYGDTDSIMINTGLDDLGQVRELGNQVKRQINKRFRLLELDIDGVYKSILLLRKKKYAALAVVEQPGGGVLLEKEMKGLDLVRRDWCRLSSAAGEDVLEHILSGASRDEVVQCIHERLRKLRDDVEAGRAPLQDYVITKGLTKAPQDYPDAKGQPHVKVAQRLLAHGKSIAVGEHIPYVVCRGDEPSFADRAFHPDEVARADGALEVDTQWYLTQQVLPPVARLCEPIAGTDMVQLAKCLGLDSSRYQLAVDGSGYGDDEASAEFALSGTGFKKQRFESVLGDDALSRCKRICVKCDVCGKNVEFQGVLSTDDSGKDLLDGLRCVHCASSGAPGTHLSLVRVVNQMARDWHALQREYFAGWLKCNEPTCQHETRQVALQPFRLQGGTLADGQRCLRTGCPGRMVLKKSPRDMYLQLQFYDRQVNMERAQRIVDRVNRERESSKACPKANLLQPLGEDAHLLAQASAMVSQWLSECDFGFVRLDDMF